MANPLTKKLVELQANLENALSAGVDFAGTAKPGFLDFKGKQRERYRNAVLSGISAAERELAGMKKLVSEDSAVYLTQLASLLAQFREKKEIKIIERMIELSEKLALPQTIVRKPAYIPLDIRDDMTADIDELEKCFRLGCHRSAAMLCGRLIETALHRLYFDATGIDLLEKSPGIGLGNIIAKIAEKGIELDPGLANQIHLINQIRIFSVHKKKKAFYLSAAQAQAMIIYTMDTIERLFRKK